MEIGYDRPPCVLPFDHRAAFSKTMFGWTVPLTPEHTAEIAAIKDVIYDTLPARSRATVPSGGSRPPTASEWTSSSERSEGWWVDRENGT